MGNYTSIISSKDPLLIAQKASPSKIGAIGSLLLLEQPERIASVCDALNIVLMTLQMTDDFTDMKQDAVHGGYNSYLSHISMTLHQEYRAHSLHESAHHNVFNSQFMNTYVDIAQQYNSALTSSNALYRNSLFLIPICAADWYKLFRI